MMKINTTSEGPTGAKQRISRTGIWDRVRRDQWLRCECETLQEALNLAQLAGQYRKRHQKNWDIVRRGMTVFIKESDANGMETRPLNEGGARQE